MNRYIPEIVRPFIESITGNSRPINTISKTNNLSKYQSSSTETKSLMDWSSFGTYGSTFAPTLSILPNSIGRIIAYLFSILVIIIVIILFIHYFITPIIKLKPGTPGIILIPGFDDGVLFWNKGMVSEIKNEDLPIKNMYYGYTIMIDVFVQNPMQFSRRPRILFTRGATKSDTSNGSSSNMNSTMLSIYKNYNLAVGLAPDTNDLIVSVLNKDNGMEEVKLSNIPIQEAFRLGIVVMEKAMEVYINGHLMKTRTFTTELKDVKGAIIPFLETEENITKLRNLKIWSRILTTPEIREAKPSLSTASDMNAGAIPVTSLCT